MDKITPFLWFDTQAEEAANFYVSLFDDADVTEVMRYPEGAPGPAGNVMTVAFFTSRASEFMGLNGGPQFPFTEAVSFTVNCKDQAEVDRLWAPTHGRRRGEPVRLVEGPLRPQLADRPRAAGELLGDPDPDRAQRAMQAMLQDAEDRPPGDGGRRERFLDPRIRTSFDPFTNGSHLGANVEAGRETKEVRDASRNRSDRLVVVILAGVGIGVGAYRAGERNGIAQGIEQVQVAQQNGQQVQVVHVVDDGRGFFFPGFFLFPLFLIGGIFLIKGIFMEEPVGWGTGATGPARNDDGDAVRERDDWHRRTAPAA